MSVLLSTPLCYTQVLLKWQYCPLNTFFFFFYYFICKKLTNLKNEWKCVFSTGIIFVGFRSLCSVWRECRRRGYWMYCHGPSVPCGLFYLHDLQQQTTWASLLCCGQEGILWALLHCKYLSRYLLPASFSCSWSLHIFQQKSSTNQNFCILRSFVSRGMFNMSSQECLELCCCLRNKWDLFTFSHCQK